jgi:hypothetical protein
VEPGDGGGLKCVIDIREEMHYRWSHEGGELAIIGGHGGLLLLHHDLSACGTLTGGGDGSLDNGEGCRQVN